MENPDEIIFVYGTLRMGASNHHRLEGSRFLGGGIVRGRMFRIAWYPGVVLDPDAGDVAGELHAVDPAMLAALDEYEGSEYLRTRVSVDRGPGMPPLDAWIWEYRMPVGGLARIASGDWLAAGQ